MKKALEGLKVVEFSWAVSEPFVGLILAQHGATVVHVESMRRFDILRLSAPFKDDVMDINHASLFAWFNGNKYGMNLDLSHPKGTEIAKKLVEWSDIVGENFAPGVMNRLGLGYDDLQKVKPDIIMCSTSNMGQTGPLASQPGFGVQLVAYSGFADLTGWPDRGPSQPFAAYTDFIAPPLLLVAVMAAVEYRRRTGKGQYLDLSQMETSIHFMAPTVMDYMVNQRVATRNGNRCSFAAPHGVYPCQGDDRWCAIAVFSDEEWNALCQVMDHPEWTKDMKFSTLVGRKNNEDVLDEELTKWTRHFTPEEVMERLQSVGVPASVVKDAIDVRDDPQLVHRQWRKQLEHPDMGMHNYDIGGGFILSKTPAEMDMPAPVMGQHTEFVCREMLGMSDEEFVDLYGQDVFK